MNENILENVLDPVNKELSKEIFNKEIMIGKVKYYLVDTIIRWLKKMGYEKEVIKSIYLIGSSAGYQYNDTSDIYVSVESTIPVEEIKKIWRLLPNGNILPDTKHPINFYLTHDKHDAEMADAAYDIQNDSWMKKQKVEPKEIPDTYSLEIAKFFIAGVNDRLEEYNRDRIELEFYKKYDPKEQEIKQEELDELIAKKEIEIKADLDSIYIAHRIIKGFRKEAFIAKETDLILDIKINSPNNSINNIVYKSLERYGILEKLDEAEKERRKYLKDK